MKTQNLYKNELLCEALKIWDQSGERPFEAVVESGLENVLMKALNENLLHLKAPLYRGSVRRSHHETGDILDYTIPTSWTSDESRAFDFIEGCKNPTILVMDIRVINGIYNEFNTYDEEESIIAPVKLYIKKKEMKKEMKKDGITFLYV